MPRDDIGLATCKRLLSAGSEISDVRTSAAAAEEAQKAVKHILYEAATEAAKLIKIKGTKTVTLEIITACFSKGACIGVHERNLSSAPRKGKGQRGVSLAGVDRVFREKLANDSRITEDAKKALVGAAEAYLHALGRNSGLMVKAAKRKTIHAADILAARQLRG